MERWGIERWGDGEVGDGEGGGVNIVNNVIETFIFC